MGELILLNLCRPALGCSFFQTQCTYNHHIQLNISIVLEQLSIRCQKSIFKMSISATDVFVELFGFSLFCCEMNINDSFFARHNMTILASRAYAASMTSVRLSVCNVGGL